MLAPRGNSETLMFKETMANTSIDQHPVAKGSKLQLDALIIGAGFSGLYQLHLLRDKLHLKAAIVEAGAGVGGLGTGTGTRALGVTQKATHIVIIFPTKF